MPPHFQQDFFSGILAIKRGVRDEGNPCPGPLLQRLRVEPRSWQGCLTAKLRVHACSVNTFLASL